MAENSGQIQVRNFSAAFEQMCNFVAVSKMGDVAATLAGLVEVTLLHFSKERLSNADEVSKTIATAFGIQVPAHQLEPILLNLERKRLIECPTGRFWTLSEERQIELNCRLKEIVDLEIRVRDGWLDTLGSEQRALGDEALWKALRSYLAKAFRRHGVQAAALLNPSLREVGTQNLGLGNLMKDVLEEVFTPPRLDTAKQAMSRFFVEIGDSEDRARYITQLADGAFSYFTLEIAPDLAKEFRQKLQPLTLFLDTNFLFGILDLHHNPQVEVSHDLLRAIRSHKLPFQLRYHEATEKEMRATINHYASVLKSHRWSASLSRAAVRSRSLSGIEQQFHERNAVRTVDVVEFLRTFVHFDESLREQGIQIYRPSEERMTEQSSIYADYDQFLKTNGKVEKGYETVFHDAILLDAVRAKRSTSRSSLQAGALLVTCDYYLYRYDWESSRTKGALSTTVLPTALWQILRPYMTSDTDFERSFAETFALPEFRALGSGGSRACSKMLEVLAAYSDVPEETAFKLMSNDLLLDKLRSTTDDQRVREIIDSAVMADNADLLEEKAGRAKELAEKARKIEELTAETKTSIEELAAERAQRRAFESRVEEERREHDRQKSELDNQHARDTRDAQIKLDAAAEKMGELQREKEKLERSRFVVQMTAGVAISIILDAILICAVHWWPFSWARDHKNSLAIQMASCLAIASAMIGLFAPASRKWTWSTSGFSVAGLLFFIMGKLS